MTAGGCEGYELELEYVYKAWRKTEGQLEAARKEVESLQGHLRRVELSNSKMGVKEHETELARQQKISGG